MNRYRPCKIVGNCSVQILMFYDNECMLRNVRLILEVQLNFILVRGSPPSHASSLSSLAPALGLSPLSFLIFLSGDFFFRESQLCFECRRIAGRLKFRGLGFTCSQGYWHDLHSQSFRWPLKIEWAESRVLVSWPVIRLPFFRFMLLYAGLLGPRIALPGFDTCWQGP